MAKTELQKNQERGHDEQGRKVNPPAMTQAEKDAAMGILNPPDIPEDEPGDPTLKTGDDTSTSVAMHQTDPEVLALAVKKYLESDEGKALMVPRKAAPDGNWTRNYENEPALRVYGGVEVKHGPDFRPLAPEYLQMYEGKDGEMTSDPKLALQESGLPVLTAQYKHWLALRLRGDRLDGNVRSDIQVGKFVPDDEGVAI